MQYIPYQPVLVAALSEFPDSRHQLVSQLFHCRLVELVAGDAVKVEEWEGGPEGGQQDAILLLKVETHQCNV